MFGKEQNFVNHGLIGRFVTKEKNATFFSNYAHKSWWFILATLSMSGIISLQQKKQLEEKQFPIHSKHQFFLISQGGKSWNSNKKFSIMQTGT